MQIFKSAPRNDRPTLRPAAQDPNADIERANFLLARYRVPSEQIVETMQRMDLRDKVMLEIEMRERQQELWQSDYEPFSKL